MKFILYIYRTDIYNQLNRVPYLTNYTYSIALVLVTGVSHWPGPGYLTYLVIVAFSRTASSVK